MMANFLPARLLRSLSMPIRSHVRPVVMLLSSLWLAACGGGGGGFIEIPDEEPGVPENSFVSCNNATQGLFIAGNRAIRSDITSGELFSLSGRLQIASGIVVDGDTNDVFASLTSNNDPASPQLLSNNVILHGFASAVGTFRNPSEERFYNSSDNDDYFCASLQAGQNIRMQVVDFSNQNDLDLYVFATKGALIGSSVSPNEVEQITVPADGDYLINVNAFSGISKYILQILPASNTTVAPPADFVAGELVVQYKPAVGIASRSSATQPRPQLVTMNSARTATAGSNDPLQVFNPELYEKRRTLIEAKRMQQQDDVEWAEPNYIVQPTLIPNDSLYTRQWHYPAINLPQAWDITIGDVEAPREPVIVAVIDTGVYLAHPDLAPNLI